jgi:hypothetical protein
MRIEKRNALQKDFEHCINRNSIENESNTPDFVLAEYLVACVEAWNVGCRARDKWYDVTLGPGEKRIVRDDKGEIIGAQG